MLIRDAVEDDLPGIFEIYDREVLHGTCTFDAEPKSAQQRLDWLGSHAPPKYPALVCVEPDHGGSRVLGWVSLSPWSARCAYARAAESSVYVHHSCRGRGVGRALMERVFDRAKSQSVAVVLARIVEGNPVSLKLHERMGFSTVGVMHRVGEKFGQILDVRLLERHLDEA